MLSDNHEDYIFLSVDVEEETKLHPLSIQHFVLALVLYHWYLFHFDSTVTVLTNDDLATLLKKLDEVAYQWQMMGIQLGFKPGVLNGIESTVHGNVQSCLKELLTRWLQRKQPPPTLQSLIDVVGDLPIANQVLAEQLIVECGDFPSIRKRCKFSMCILS